MVNPPKRMHRGALRTQAEISELEALRAKAFPHLYPPAKSLSDAELLAKCVETGEASPSVVKNDDGRKLPRFCTFCGKRHEPTCDERAES
jgi:hypothetical protein